MSKRYSGHGCRKAAWACPVFVLVACACASVGERGSHGSDAAVLANFPIVFGEPPSVILVPVTMGESEYPFIVDTGSTVTIYDTRLRSRLGEPVETQVAGMGAGNAPLTMFHAPQARLGKLDLPADVLVGCTDLSAVSNVVQDISGQEVYGILGMDFLQHYILRLDFQDKSLCLLGPECSSKEWGQAFPIAYGDEGVPALVATLPGGAQARFLIDTGDAGTGDIESPLFDRLLAQGSLVVTGEIQCATGSGYRQAQEGQLDRLTLGPYSHDRLRLFSSHWNGLGLGYLSHYVVTFDFPREMIYLQPKAAPAPHSHKG